MKLVFLFKQNSKYCQFPIIEEEQKQQVCTFEEMELVNFYINKVYEVLNLVDYC